MEVLELSAKHDIRGRIKDEEDGRESSSSGGSSTPAEYFNNLELDSGSASNHVSQGTQVEEENTPGDPSPSTLQYMHRQRSTLAGHWSRSHNRSIIYDRQLIEEHGLGTYGPHSEPGLASYIRDGLHGQFFIRRRPSHQQPGCFGCGGPQ